ncbi:hypothetical protein D3C86_2138820 [compost metagenome]
MDQSNQWLALRPGIAPSVELHDIVETLLRVLGEKQCALPLRRNSQQAGGNFNPLHFPAVEFGIAPDHHPRRSEASEEF